MATLYTVNADKNKNIYFALSLICTIFAAI